MQEDPALFPVILLCPLLCSVCTEDLPSQQHPARFEPVQNLQDVGNAQETSNFFVVSSKNKNHIKSASLNNYSKDIQGTVYDMV